jgi:hypothetical protein
MVMEDAKWPPLGAAVLCYARNEPRVVFAGTVLSSNREPYVVRLDWASDKRPIIYGTTREFTRDTLLPPPQSLVAGLAGMDAQFAALGLHKERSEAAVKLVGFWLAFQKESKAEVVADLVTALQLDQQELARAVMTALIAADADEHGVEPAVTPEGVSLRVHDANEHDLYGACRFCSAVVAATYRANAGRITGFKPPKGRFDA